MMDNDAWKDTEIEWYRQNFEELRKKHIQTGQGFIIKDRKGLRKVKRKRNDGKDFKSYEKTEDGIFSPKFGPIWKDKDAFKSLYRCECGELIGKAEKGVTCIKCGSKVTYRDKNVNKYGWFYLQNYKLIHPNLFYLIQSLIGPSKLKGILDIKKSESWEADENGIITLPEVNEKSRNDNKYQGIGFIEFIKRFDEILDFYLSKKKDKKDIYNEIMKDREKVFTNSLPVIGFFLRPIHITTEDYNYDKLNKKYSPLSLKIYTLNHKYLDANLDDNTILKRVNDYLYECQKTYMELDNLIGKLLNQKSGLVQCDLIGSRYDHTGRFVITPSSGKINQVEMPYIGFLHLYKPEICNQISQLYKCNVNKAEIIWKAATFKFDEKVYYIMEYLIKNYDMYVLINRNPTLNYGSILRMKIGIIKKDYSDLTLSVPINILALIAGDFDGDTNNTMALKTKAMVKAYSLFDPSNMAISKNNGLFNDALNLIKDQIVTLNEFCRLGRKTTKIKASRFEVNDHIDSNKIYIKYNGPKKKVKIVANKIKPKIKIVANRI